MTLALQSVRLMLIVSALASLLMLVLWLGTNNKEAQIPFYTYGAYLVASAAFVKWLPSGKKGVKIAFAMYCMILIVGSKMGGLTLTTFPSYIMTLLGFLGVLGVGQSRLPGGAQ